MKLRTNVSPELAQFLVACVLHTSKTFIGEDGSLAMAKAGQISLENDLTPNPRTPLGELLRELEALGGITRTTFLAPPNIQ